MTTGDESFRTTVAEVLQRLTNLQVQTDERLNSLEESNARLEESNAGLEESNARFEERLTRLEELSIRMSDLLAEVTEIALEMQRDSRQTRRIWIAIARKQELFDDDEFDDVFGE